MRTRFFLALTVVVLALPLMAQNKAEVILNGNESGPVIPKEIYGQFAEHLGRCIYGGLWVGPDSESQQANGYRTDVLTALKELKIPVLRWPGGCFADEYHWMDGIGDVSSRPRLVNNNWGGTVEDNSFGTHEFFNLCELLGCEPYLSGNVGSGTVEELAKWVEYVTAEEGSTMANLRVANGRQAPWKLKYIGIGNESWGCGGNMRPEYYSDIYRRYALYCRDYGDNRLFKVASGANDYDYNWTEVLMNKVGNQMHGLSLHYYTWSGGKSATDFTAQEYYDLLGKCREIEEVIEKHCAIMDKYDPEKHVALMLDEWGTWFAVEPGTNPGHLYQQNTMRDAMVASLTFDIFNRHTDRLKMANIAQIVNVLQSMILTNETGMVCTPTYHVFRMYNIHQDAEYIPTSVLCDTIDVSYNRKLPLVSATASKDSEGKTHICLSNVDLEHGCQVSVTLSGIKAGTVTGEILTAERINDHNTFEEPHLVEPATFNGAKLKGNKLYVNLPAKAIVSLELE